MVERLSNRAAVFFELALNDLLEVIYGIAHTVRDRGFDFSGAENISGTYGFPVTQWATTLALNATKSDTSVLQAPFTSLNKALTRH